MNEKIDKPITAIELEKILNKVLLTNKVLPSPELSKRHELEHDFIKEMIARRKKNSERWEKFKRSAIGAIAVVIVGWGIAGLTLIGNYILENWN